jgi:UDP-GlcNAc:undecaprenyl-phosphate GlcNAc-1-phosphate transferase
LTSQHLIYGLALLMGFGICYGLVPLCQFVSRRSDVVDRPREHKTHDSPTALFGGVAVFVAVWSALLFLVGQSFFTWGAELRGLLIGSSIVLVLGLIDDSRDISPLVKFIGQLLATIVVIYHGVAISLFVGPGLLTYTLTALWIVGITNSFNLLDNMDGLTCGVATICCFIFAVSSFRQGDPHTVVMSLTMGGALIAFLRFNFEPAEIFLGDAGSGFIGFYLAVLSVAANYLETSELQQLPIITPILIFSVPIFDTFSVMAIRILEGRSIWDADNRHFSHRLVSLGLSRRDAVLVIYLVTFTVGVLALLLARVNLFDAILLLVHAMAIFAIIVILEYASLTENSEDDSTQ